MRKIRSSGMTLIEVLVSMMIFSIGALGVLGMFTTTLYLNMDARQSQDATVIGNWFLEQVQILPLSDPHVMGCAAPNGCWADVDAGGALNSVPFGQVRTLTISELEGDAPSGTRFQVHWIREDGVPAAGMAHFRVRVYWPRRREDRALEPGDAGFVNCFTTPGSCRRLEMNTYK